jgi:hypothetical protein
MMHTVGEVNAADSDNEENCEDTTRLSGMSMTELKETRMNGHNIDVDLWEAGRARRTAASVETSTPAGDTRNSLAFMSAAEPRPTPELREGNPSTTGEKTWYTFYDTQNVPQIVDDWLQTRANSQTRRIEEQEQFIGDFTTYLKHRSGEVKAILSKTEDVAVMPPPMYFVTGMPGTGKSFVSQELRSLFDALGMEENLDYVFTAYMASTALQSSGQTMHHLMGANMYGDGSAANVDGQRLQIIIVDEISMVDAKLFSTFGVKINFEVQMRKESVGCVQFRRMHSDMLRRLRATSANRRHDARHAARRDLPPSHARPRDSQRVGVVLGQPRAQTVRAVRASTVRR